MTTNSQKIYNRAKEAGLIDRGKYIKFKGTGEHIVKFVSDKAIESRNFRTGRPEKKMQYVFEEDNEEKLYETAIFKISKDEETGEEKKKLSSFVESMSQFEYEDILKMTYTPISGTPRGYVKIEKMNLGEVEKKELEERDDYEVPDKEIPVVEDEEPVVRKKVPLAEGGEVDADEIPF